MVVEFKEMEKGTCLFINGEEITHYFKEEQISNDGEVIFIDVLANDFELEVDEIDELLNLSLSDIPECFSIYKEKYKNIMGATISLSINYDHVALVVEHDLEIWANQYSYINFNKLFCDLLSNGIYFLDIRSTTELYLDTEKIESNSISVELSAALNFINKCYLEAHEILIEQTKEDIFIKVFEFPAEYKNIFSQYLIWFGEFLQNLGLDANVSTEQSKNQTQLIVSPNECPELLTEIEKLFYQYLSLPYAELLPPESNLTPQELHAYQAVKMQVQHLQTQVQMKDSVIASYQATNTNLINKISEKESELVLINSLKEDNKIEVFGGILKFNKFIKLGKNDNILFDLSKAIKLISK